MTGECFRNNQFPSVLVDSSMTYLFRQFSSFVAVSFIATGVHYALLIALVELAGISAVAAALIGFGAGGTVSYGLNRRHVFRSDRPHHAAASRFALVAAVGFGLTFLFMSLLVNAAGVPYLAAQVATTGIVMFWNFAAHKIWTFSPYRDAQ
jgi:putative flippase GtrA